MLTSANIGQIYAWLASQTEHKSCEEVISVTYGNQIHTATMHANRI